MSEIVSLLAQQHGIPIWQPRADPLSELIATILSQNTSDINSSRAYGCLRESFGGWGEAARAPVEDIARAIQVGGLEWVKASRIKGILQRLERQGSFDLSFLADMSLSEAKAWLRALPGVGPKTAACVLMFSLGRPALPVDTHVYRVARRLGLIGARVSVERAHEALEAMLQPEDVYQFHVNMVRHGRAVCRAQRPRCPECLLRAGCPSAALYCPPEGALHP